MSDGFNGPLTQAERHTYLAQARPEWARSMASIQSEGGPWWCSSCRSASMLVYRCSICGRDLAGETTTHGRQG